MKILVYGTGVIGTIYGDVLSQAGHEVAHYVRTGRPAGRGSALDLNLLDGRTAEPHQLHLRYAARIVDGFGPADRYDLILVSLKHYDVPAVLYQLAVDAGKADILFFSNWWDDLTAIDEVLAGRYLWGFPVAGGGWNDGVLDAALLDTIHLGEVGGTATARLTRIRGLFESAGLKVEIEPNILHWLWVHFATEAALISAAISAGSVDALLDDTAQLESAILAGREALEVCRARGVALEQIPDAATFLAPADAVAVVIHDFYATNLPARRILERHTSVEELKRIYADVVATGQQLGVPMPRLTEVGPAVEAWTGGPATRSGEASSRLPVTAGG
ncbi:MAG TPA: 2-dehydropantoate 2-reductase N-terminal domain-containing protein [Candidatus Limnocylindrales bacterium]